MSSTPLISEALCVNCAKIVENLDTCPKCGSKLTRLSKVINKEAKTAWLIAL